MDKFTFEHAGMQFECVVSQDDVLRAPWDEHDGHGSVRTAYRYYGKPDKRPGEVIIWSERGDHWIYDFAGAVKKARAEKWGFTGARVFMTPNQIAAEAVRRDMDYCREWLRGDRMWASIEVYRVDAEGERIGESEYLGGIDYGYSSEDDKHLREYAAELAGTIADAARTAWLAALKEARARRYWAARDVETVGA